MAKKKPTKVKPAPPKGSENICFTIMPFGDWFDSYYEAIYTPAIQAAGLVPRRADDLYRPSAIVHDIWALTQSAKVLLADLSGKNPNVFYELGLAHAIARPAILVTDSIADIPFDLRALRVIVYDKNEPDWGTILKDSIEKAIKEVLAAPLEAVLPTFLKVRESSRTSVTPAEKELISLRQDMDLLRRELQVRREDFTPRRIPSSEAKERIRRYVSGGAPDDFIIKKLSEMGAPTPWLRDQIHRIKTETMQESAPIEVDAPKEVLPNS